MHMEYIYIAIAGYREGAAQNLRRVLHEYKADITTLQEIGWSGDIYYGCQTRKNEFGVGGKTRYCVINWVPIREGVGVIRLNAKFYNISIICAHCTH